MLAGRTTIRDEAPLARLLALEARGGVEASAYGAALRALAVALRADVGATRAGLSDWLLAGLGLLPEGPANDPWREALWDASADLLADADGLARLLDKAAARLVDRDPPPRFNLLSMLRAKAAWRAKDMLRRRRAWQQRHAAAGLEIGVVDPQARCLAGLVVEQVARQFGDEPGVGDALAALLQGHSVTEVARRTGQSRQAIYRGLARVRAWLEMPPLEEVRREHV